ncbi:hypothetical protein HAHE_31610 [Haloferula helveola]|uniref:Uncharacterized protein n=1 Tax=Haloferula helveola TaxID=490095 RepID=A0ABM7RPM0_9BACT|nr:hypothetical protein HAHE_31610 [Haloferula helveola]
MKGPRFLTILAALGIVLPSGCANFRRLGEDLKFIDETSIVTAHVKNTSKQHQTFGLVVEWDREDNKVESADFAEVGPVGVFGFVVKEKDNQYLMAFSDRNDNGRYDSSDPAWIHSDSSGNPVPVRIDPETDKARVEGSLSSSTRLPNDLVEAAREFRGARTTEEAATGWSIPVDLGTIADLDAPKFSSERGSQGYWEPAAYPMETGIGIYFLQKYEPNRTPVLFVYGAAGSPQDWRTFFNKIDRKKYQPWFFHYPTGRRLDELGSSLNRAVELLQAYYGFNKMHVVAHSMGGLVSRDFIVKNRRDGNRYISRYVTISTPWGGQDFAKSGVKHAPSVVPSWYDMVPGSDFQRDIFDDKLKGKVPHLLFYGHRAKRSFTLPEENDGTVSVASQTDEKATSDAVGVHGYDEDHVSILSNDDVLRRTFRHLDGG